MVNHYWTKSEEECLQKLSKPTAYGVPRRDAAHEHALGGTLNEVLDEEILRYVPALREELARVESRRGNLCRLGSESQARSSEGIEPSKRGVATPCWF